jgi:2'-5' RNA ligase
VPAHNPLSEARSASSIGGAARGACPRVFFALWPEPGVQASLQAWGQAWAAVAGGRPCRAASIHLTLAFLGEMAPGGPALEPVRVAAAACALRPFTLVIDRAGCFPGRRLGWLGPGRCPPELLDAVDQLRRALTGAGVAFDPQPFVPHVTVLRGVRRFEYAAPPPPVQWPVASFALMASVPGEGGRIYRRLGEWSAAP